MNRLLLLHVSIGLGHKSAALALARAFESAPDTVAQVEDTLDYTRGWFRRGYAGAYLDIAAVAPRLWSHYYAHTDRPNRIMDGARALSTRLGTHGIAALLDRFQPDAIICTHFMPVEALTQLGRANLPPIYEVITDYHAHHFWACPGVERYFAPTAATREQLVAAGVDRRRVEVTGIPIDLAAHSPSGPEAARRAFELAADRPVVALIGSGLPTEQVRAIAEALLAQPAPKTVVVAAGRNRELVAGLADLARVAGARLHVLGYQPTLTPLLAASDLAISKAGGLTVSEALALGLPLVIPAAQLVGQERWNADYVIGAGAGLGCDTPPEIAQAVGDLLHTPARLAGMRSAARELGRPNAAAAIKARVLADVMQRCAPARFRYSNTVRAEQS